MPSRERMRGAGAGRRTQRVPGRDRPHSRHSDTNAEYFYDYAGDDPINMTDPSGMCVVWCHPLRTLKHGANWAARHVEQIDYVGAAAFCAEGLEFGGEIGSAAGPLGAVAGGVGGCVVNGLTELIIVHRARDKILEQGG